MNTVPFHQRATLRYHCVIVNVPPADDDQAVRVPKTGETGEETCPGWMTICLLWHNNRESTLNTVSGVATDCSGTKAEPATKLCNNAHKGKRGTDPSDLQQCVQRQKGSTDLSDLSLNRWLDDAAIQQGANRVSCQVTVVVVVTCIDVSPTGSRNFDGGVTLGTLSRSRFS